MGWDGMGWAQGSSDCAYDGDRGTLSKQMEPNVTSLNQLVRLCVLLCNSTSLSPIAPVTFGLVNLYVLPAYTPMEIASKYLDLKRLISIFK